MASIKYDEYKVKLNNLRPTLDNLGQSLGLEAAAEELDLLQAQSAAEDFWSNMEKAQKVSQRIKNLQDKLEAQQKRLDTVEDLLVLCEMGQPDPLLRLHALHHGQRHPYRLRDQQRQRRHGRRPGRVHQRLPHLRGYRYLGY